MNFAALLFQQKKGIGCYKFICMNRKDKDYSKGVILDTLLLALLLFTYSNTYSQVGNAPGELSSASLPNCIEYAIQHNPDIRNAKINEDITEATIKNKLADWYPQVNFNYSLQHNFQLPTVNFNGNITHSGSRNVSGADFGFTQNIFNRDALLATRSSKEVRLSANQNTRLQKIDLAAAVSKAFYALILTGQQIKTIDEDILRISQSLKDAYYQYQAGVVDKTDYKRATISLNNAKAQRYAANESIHGQKAALKELMGYPASQDLQLVYDSAQLEKEIFLDTLQQVDYNSRVEILQLQTQRRLLEFNLKYNQWSYLPNVYAFGNYNLNFLDNKFTKLYAKAYPNSFAGLTLSIPIFQGGKRIQQIKQAKLQIDQTNNEIVSAQNAIQTQYETAMAAYKSNLYNYNSLKENMLLANEVYNVIQLQYRSGIKTYLDVITAETDLRTAQINYFNALFQVLSSKIDLSKALGTLTY